jgi:hypothetical protein
VRIVRENDQTDTEASIITLEDNQGRQKRYVRRNRNAPLPSGPPDLLLSGKLPLDFTRGNCLDKNNLPDRLTVGLNTGQPVVHQGAVSAAVTDFLAAHEYEADELAFWVWEECRDRTLRETGGSLAPDDLRDLLATTDPLPLKQPWDIAKVRAEVAAWLKDKGKA